MQADRWSQVKEIFALACERAPNERVAYVQEACGGDEELRAEVMSLLEAHDDAGDFIAKPAAQQVGLAAEKKPPKDWIGTRLGPYRIIAEAGRGGMSQVFKAVRDDAQYEKQVAIKLLRPGLDTESVLKRFRAERQILARLSHPHIAHLLDGGATEDGAPYLVMEFIEGKPIDDYCDEHDLDVRQRLDLFRDLCAAVHYVHQHLMVHGDLKGSNVLVTDTGVVKLLDFGIAKLLGPTPATAEEPRATTFLALTPEYASPEQVRGEPITTASDVYSLGVLLYRLLAGSVPHKASSTSTWQLAKEICEDDALPPSVMAAKSGAPYARFEKVLRNELDNVVLKALKKDPAERYGSAEQLADDLRRYLRGFPVAARPDTRSYRARKFVRRHKAAVVAASLFAFSLLAGIATTAWQAHVAHLERARAERHFNEIRELTSVYLADVYESVEDLPGGTTARKLLVENSIKYLRALEREAQDSPELQRDLARAYERLGDVQGEYIGANIGDTQGAADNYRRALNIRRSLAKREPSVEADRQVIRSCVMLTEILIGQSAVDEALRLAREAADISHRLLKEGHRTDEDLYYAGTAILTLGWEQGLLGDIVVGMKSMTYARDLFKELAARKPDDANIQRSLGLIAARIGNVYLENPNPQPEKALPFYQEALAIMEPLAKQNPHDADFQRGTAFLLTTIGEAMTDVGQAREALPLHDRALASIERLHAADETDRLAPLAIAFIANYRGRTQLALNNYDAALKDFSRAETILRNAPPSQPTDIAEIRLLPGMTYANLASAMSEIAQRASTPAGLRRNYAREASEWSRRATTALQPLIGDVLEGPRAKRFAVQAEQAVQVLEQS